MAGLQIPADAIPDQEVDQGLAFLALLDREEFDHLELGQVGDVGAAAHVVVDVADLDDPDGAIVALGEASGARPVEFRVPRLEGPDLYLDGLSNGVVARHLDLEHLLCRDVFPVGIGQILQLVDFLVGVQLIHRLMRTKNSCTTI